jgi:hypothetical protein
MAFHKASWVISCTRPLATCGAADDGLDGTGRCGRSVLANIISSFLSLDYSLLKRLFLSVISPRKQKK